MSTITEAEKAVLKSLRERGYVIAVFTPEEVKGIDANAVRDRMVEAGNDAIDVLQKRNKERKKREART